MAGNIIRLDTIEKYNNLLGAETLHPLVSITDLSRLESIRHCRKEYGFYCIYYKELECGTIRYGRSKYDYQEGTLLFISPGQTAGVDDDGETLNPRGFALMFHPDLLYGTPLARRMKDYTFFSYDSNEALHMSEREKEIIASRFEQTLHEWFESGKAKERGLPTVQMCAGTACLSPNYFGDLIKKELGKTAQEYIQLYVIARAKELIAENELNVSETAYELGFKYPHHLTRVFKKVTGMTPSEYRHKTGKEPDKGNQPTSM